MKNLSLTFCLAIAALFGSVGSGFAADCYSSPVKCTSTSVMYYACLSNPRRWDTNKKFAGHVREAKRRGLTCVAKGAKYVKPSPIRTAFIKLSKENRKQLQSNLKDLGFYKSSIDGLYGRGTAGALTAYNKQNLNGADLKKSKNVNKLINAVLALKPVPKIIPKTQSDENPKPKRDLEKEFGLSLYGSFLHSENVPNALFFFDYIERNDNFEFRKALRNHDVDIIILSSPGGLVWEGLIIAGIINDKGLNVYVPKSSVKGDGSCASACSFMFFAGETRNVEGKLGVHQFLSKESEKREKVGDTQKTAQFTVSEIIGFLNEFKTPPWVFERMFQQSEMYYFKETELVQLETEVSDELVAHYEKSETFISDFAKAFAEVSE
jgi:hypothetical protein